MYFNISVAGVFCIFWPEYHRSDVPFFMHHSMGYIMAIHLNTGDANFVHLVTVVPAEFPPCKVTIFSFVINIYLGGNTLRLHKYPVFPHTLPTNFSNISSCLKPLFCSDFSVSLVISTFINWDSSVRKSCLFPLFTCLFNFLHQCGLISVYFVL